MLRFLLYSAITFCTLNARAQTADSTSGGSPVRTLTYQQYREYVDGEAGGDMARVAEMNHYPLPDKVLKYKAELDLSPIQVKKISDINTQMHRRRLQIGGSVIDTEKKLDSLFRYNKINDGSLVFYTNRYGLYQGELKNAILQACLATQKLLSQQQVNKLEAILRRK